MRAFLRPNRDQLSLLPAAIEDWLPDGHLARFVVEVVEELDLSLYYDAYGESGAPAYDPGMMLSLLFYGYATGVFSSRKLEAGTYDSVAFRFISGDLHPDHDSIAHFRRRFLPLLEQTFKDILVLGSSMGLVQLGNVYIDGTKIQANASRHHAMSYGYLQELEARVEKEVATLLALGEQADQQAAVELDIPQELATRAKRKEKIRRAKAELEKRAKQRHDSEQQAYEQKMQKRAQKQDQTGKKPGGKPPQPPGDATPKSKDQYNFTDPESRIMKTPRGYDQCFNAQAAVNEDMLILGAHLTNRVTDRQELLPTLDAICPALGKPPVAIADAGYFSKENVEQCGKREVEAYLAIARNKHNSWLEEQHQPAEKTDQQQDSTPAQQMAAKLKTKHGKELYRKRKMTVEPVFGIIKEVMGFRRFSLRGEKQAAGEWMLVCAAYNLKRLFNIAKNTPRKTARFIQNLQLLITAYLDLLIAKTISTSLPCRFYRQYLQKGGLRFTSPTGC